MDLCNLREQLDIAQTNYSSDKTKDTAIKLAEATEKYIAALVENSAISLKETFKVESPKDTLSEVLVALDGKAFSPWMLRASTGSSDAPRLLRHLKNDFNYKFNRKSNTYTVLNKRPEIEWQNYGFDFALKKLSEGYLYHHEVPQWVGYCCDIIRHKYKKERQRKLAITQLKILVSPYVTSNQGKKVLRNLKADGAILRTPANARIVTQMEHARIHKGKRVPSSWAFIDLLNV